MLGGWGGREAGPLIWLARVDPFSLSYLRTVLCEVVLDFLIVGVGACEPPNSDQGRGCLSNL